MRGGTGGAASAASGEPVEWRPGRAGIVAFTTTFTPAGSTATSRATPAPRAAFKPRPPSTARAVAMRMSRMPSQLGKRPQDSAPQPQRNVHQRPGPAAAHQTGRLHHAPHAATPVAAALAVAEGRGQGQGHPAGRCDVERAPSGQPGRGADGDLVCATVEAVADEVAAAAAPDALAWERLASRPAAMRELDDGEDSIFASFDLSAAVAGARPSAAAPGPSDAAAATGADGAAAADAESPTAAARAEGVAADEVEAAAADEEPAAAANGEEAAAADEEEEAAANGEEEAAALQPSAGTGIGDAAVGPPPAVTGPTSSPEHSSMASPYGESGHGGDGGCTAVALTTLGVWPTLAEAVAALDAQIAPLHAKWQRLRGQCEEAEAGLTGEQWHDEAILNAIKAKGWHVRKLVLHPTKAAAVSLKAELGHGRYLVFGVTNNEWSKRVKGKVKPQPLKYPGWPADAPHGSAAGWMHTVAIVDGRLRDFDASMRLTAEHPLWLRKDNQPDREKGWLRSIRAVWRVFPCSRPGDGCRGECAAAERE